MTKETVKETVKEIVNKTQKEITITKKLDEEQLSDLLLNLADANLKISNLEKDLIDLKNRPVSTISTGGSTTYIQLPSTNTGGVGPIISNPQKVETEKLTVTGSTNFQTLTVSADATFDTDTLYVNSTKNRVGIGTTSPAVTLHVIGSEIISDNLNVGSYASAAQYFGASLADCNSAANTALQWDDSTGKFSCATITGVTGSSVSSNSLDFDEFVNTMTLDADLRINTPSSRKIGIGAAPSTYFEVQGTASASYLLTTNTLQVGGPASVAYSRFGTGTTSEAHYITTTNDLFISGDIEVDGSVSFAGPASISNVLYVGTLNNAANVGIGDSTPDFLLDVAGTLGVDGNTTLGDATGDTVTANADSWTFVNDTNFVLSGGANGLSFDTSTLSIDATNNRVGILTTAPVTTFEVQGTASASYLLTTNTLQVGGPTSVAYSRFGTGTTSEAHYITTTNDVFITGDMEVDGSVSFAGPASISNVLYVGTLNNAANVGIGD
ncbi:MAG: hypothetical protein AAB972_00415, partial [Patescibacteria group bacterium]